jgi:glucose/arabinose dehydrogenase
LEDQVKRTNSSCNILLLALLALCPPVSAQTVNDPNLEVTQVATGLSAPTAMVFLAQGDILVTQKNDGRVRRVIWGVVQPGQVLDVAVDNLSERGLLGMALHPNFPGTPSVYLYYTESSTGSDTSGTATPLGNRVYRYTWNGSALVSPSLILNLPVTDGPNHNGGTITFGPDGKLYVIIGDLNRNGQLQNFSGGPAPDNTSVILRINDNGTIPGDNPFAALGGNLAKYYAYGIRNSFGMAFDPLTGILWDTENGPADYDEINRILPGFNSGWEKIMGPDSRDPQGVGDLVQFSGSHYSDPEFSWFDTVGPTAIVFLNSSQLGAQYQNNAFVADIVPGNIYRFRMNAARDGFVSTHMGLGDKVADTPAELAELIFATGFGGITDLKVGPDGLLYVLSFSGQIYVVSRAGSVVPSSQLFSCGASSFTQTRIGVTGHGNVAQFNSPGLSGSEHISSAPTRSGYQVCYATGAGGPFFTAFDFTGTESGWAAGVIVSQPNGPSTFPVEITRTTADGRVRVLRRFTGNSFVASVPAGNSLDSNDDGQACSTLDECGNCTNRTLHVLTRVTNLTGSNLFNINVVELVNFNVDGTASNDRFVRTLDGVFAYEDRSDGGAGDRAGMLLQSLVTPAVTQVFSASGYAAPSNCVAASVATPTAPGNFESLLKQSFGTLGAGANTGNNIRTHYRRF